MPPLNPSATHRCSPSGACPHGQAWPSSRAHQLLPAWHPWEQAGGDPGVWVGWEVAYGSQQGLLILFTAGGLAG